VIEKKCLDLKQHLV